MPHPLAVRALANVLAQAGHVARALAVWEIAGDGIGDVVERIEAVDAEAHEIADPFDTLALQVRSHIDEDQGGRDRCRRLADRRQRRDTAERRADEDRPIEPAGDGRDITGETVEVVDAVR